MPFPSDWIVASGGGLPKGSAQLSLRAFVQGTATAFFADNAYAWRDLPGGFIWPVTPFLRAGDLSPIDYGVAPTAGGIPGALPTPRCRYLQVINDGDPIAPDSPIEFSFDGVNVHGVVFPGEVLSYAERNEAGIAVRFQGVVASGSITTVDGASLVDGETFDLDDGVNPAVTFEFDNDASVVETATLRAVTFTGLESADAIRDLIITAINNAPTLAITASDGGAATVGLVNDAPGSAGNVVVTETVGDVGFVVSGMAGGAGAPVTFRVEAW